MEEPEKKQFLHFINSPFNFEHQGVKVECNDKGMITFSKQINEDEWDEIEVPASVVSRTMKFLTSTRRRVWKDTPYEG